MKKLFCILLVALMLLPLSLAGCGKKSEPLKLGLGVYTNVSAATDADGDADGNGKVAITAALVTLSADGKIVSCVLDTADITVKYTGEGKAIANDSFATKYEQGDGYNMKLYGGASKEWYEQADAFAGVVKGKTLYEVKALLAGENKGNEEVVNAGCTIMVNEFILAIEKAVANASESDATAECKLSLGAHTEQSTKDATEDKDGQNQIETTFFGAALDGDGKIAAASTECIQIAFTFDIDGKSTFDTSKAIVGKKEAGQGYGISAYGTDINGDGTVKEWVDQANAFAAATIGKTPAEVASLMGSDSYGTADVQSAGCTILVNGFVKAAAKLK